MEKMNTKKRKKTLKLYSASILFFFTSLLLYLVSSLFLRTYNNSLSLKTQSILSEIHQIQVENESINITIQNLSSRDRVVAIASDSGLELNQDNIITISDGE